MRGLLYHVACQLQPCSSQVGGGMRTGKVLCPKTNNLVVWRRRAQKAEGEDLPARLPEVLGQEGVEDGVDARVPVRQAVSDDAEGKGRVVQREDAKLHPHGDDVVRQPAEGEGGDQQKNCLSHLCFGLL